MPNHPEHPDNCDHHESHPIHDAVHGAEAIFFADHSDHPPIALEEVYRPWNIVHVCEKHGVENVLFVLPMSPVRRILGIPFLGYRSSSDQQLPILCKITEDNYKVAQDYKIELIPQSEDFKGFGKDSFYISDLAGMIRTGRVQILIKHDLSYRK